LARGADCGWITGNSETDPQPKSVDGFAGQDFDFVVTVCDSARESCPFFPGGRVRLHHSFEDPAAAPADEQRQRFRVMRDEIRRWLEVEFIPTASRGT